jgi:protein O-GlcNAc transferase
LSRSAAAIQTALAQLDANQNEQAKVTLRRVLQKNPADPDANKLMGMLLSGLDENEQALFFLKRAAQSAPKDSQLRFMLGNLYMIMRRDNESIETFRDALRLDPANLPAVDGLGKCLLRIGDHAGAVVAFEAGIAASPDNPVAYRAMASALSTMGRVPEAIAALRRGVHRLPTDTGLRESLCYQSNFAGDMTKEQVFEEHVALGRLVHQEGLRRPAHRLTDNKKPDAPLRVGFLSGDFCIHACATFMEGLIRELDRTSFQPFLYYVRPEVEPPTRRFAAMVGPNQWRHVPGIPHQHLAQVIGADSLDILIDTMGWTEQQRMAALEPRVAPIQATWLGYPNTTALPSMDYRIVDAITDPPGAEAFCTEKLLRLPGCFLSFLPDPTAPEPATTSLLAVPTSHITFGSFNRLSKVGPEVARTWAAILRAVPGSRLFLKSSLVSEDVKAQYIREFAGAGIEADRLLWSSFVDTMHDHLAMYHQVDIALDSFPYNGTTTTCEATWMGVPVITLRGEAGVHRARVGASLLTALGLPELIASTREQYIQIATDLANNRPRLTEYHSTLRPRMGASSLCDSKAFARKLEAALRQVWREWCAQPAR